MAYPRVLTVTATEGFGLVVEFSNREIRRYDFTPWLAKGEFRLLRTPAFFKAVSVAPGGYGIEWNDDLDLSEAELWENGR
jgi:hypothetical protein